MKNFYKIFLIFFLMTQIAWANVPSIHTIYKTVQSGNLSRAHQMIEAVLKVHPNSAKAHYVAAEVFIREGDAKEAREELEIAQKIEPNLPFVHQQDVMRLEQRISSLTQHHSLQKTSSNSHSWILWVILIAALFLLYLLWKKSSQRGGAYKRYPSMQHNPNNPQNAQNSANSGGGMFGGGLFSSILSGLGMGAGFAAGEHIIDNLMDSHNGDEHTNFSQPEIENEQNYTDTTENDFGINESSSWDDDASFGDDDFGSDDNSW